MSYALAGTMKRKKKRKKNILSEYWLLVTLMVIGLAYRIYHLDVQSYWIDESYSINAALAILSYGYPLLESGALYLRDPLFHYMLAGIIGMFGLSEWSVRMVSVIFGTAFIPLIYYLGKEFGSRNIGYISAVLWTFLSIAIAWSRQARMYMAFAFFFYLAILFFYKAIEERKAGYALSCGIATIAASLMHSTGLFLFLIYGLYGIVIMMHSITQIRTAIAKSYHLGLEWIRKHPMTILGLSAACGLIFFWRYAAIKGVLQTSIDYFGWYTSYFQQEYGFMIFFSIAGFLFFRRLKESLLFLIVICVMLYFVSFHQMLFAPRYLFVIIPLLVILSAYSINHIIVRFGRMYRYLAGVPIMLILIAAYASGIFTLVPQESYLLERGTPQPDFKSAYAYVLENYEEGERVVSSYSTIAYLYLGRDADYTLNFSLSRLPGTSLEYRHTGTDVYRGVEIFSVDSDLSGFVIIDSMAYSRVSGDVRRFLDSEMTVAYQGKDIRVYYRPY